MNTKSMKYLVVGLALSALTLLAGCATTGTHSATEPFSAKLSDYTKVNVVLVNNNPDATPELKTIQTQVESQLNPVIAVTQLQQGEKAPGVLGMKLEIVDFKAPGGFTHLVACGMAPDLVSVNGTLYDVTTGKTIGKFTSSGETHLSGIVVGDTGTFRASTELGNQIAQLLKSSMYELDFSQS